MTTRVPHHHGDTVTQFGEGALRPPVPGEENVMCDTVRPEIYEPEGRASSDHAHPGWAESLDMLLDDPDGILLFREFLAQKGCTDVIDFWLACSGFRLAYHTPLSCLHTSTDMLDKQRLKLAKAIYRKYIISNGDVAKKINPVTKSFICVRVCHSQLDSMLFQQAKQEVQEAMEVEAYPSFLKSNVFLTYKQEINNEQENNKQEEKDHKQETENNKKKIIKFQQETKYKQEVKSFILEAGNDKLEMSSHIQELGSAKKEPKHETEMGKQEVLRHKQRHRIIQGCVRADAYKTSFLDKLHIHHMSKDIYTEPDKFAAALINRLELVQRERENWGQAEEHLTPHYMKQEYDGDAKVSSASSLCPTHLNPACHDSSHFTVQWCDTHTENPDVIPSVIMTPSWRSPITHIHSHICPMCDTWHHHHGDMAGTNQSEVLGYSSRRKSVCENMMVVYYFCGELIPYQMTVPGRVVTLTLFRELLTKKGAYRFFFKKVSDEFDCGVVYEEVCEDAAILPVFEGRIIGKVVKIH